MSRVIKLPTAIFKFGSYCKKHKILYLRVVDASEHFDSHEYPFILQFRLIDSFHWLDLNRYTFWSDAHDAMLKLVDRFDNVFLE